MHKSNNSCMYIFQIIPVGTLVNAILCPFCQLKTVLAIRMKPHTVVEHNETMCHVQEQKSALHILQLFPFDHLHK